MKEKIIEVLKSVTSIDNEDLIKKLNLSSNQYEEYAECLNELMRNYLVYGTKKNKIMLIENSHLLTGKIQITKSGNGFLLQEEADIYIDSSDLNGALDGDIVVVEKLKAKGKKEAGRVLSVTNSANEEFVGIITRDDNEFFVKPSDRKHANLTLKIGKDKQLGAVEGDVVRCAKVYSKGDAFFEVEVTEVVANHNDPDKDMLMILAKHNIETEFNEAVLKEAKKVPSEIDENDTAGRVDLRDELIFTIDGDDTQDIDDAIGIKRTKSGYHLSVHIADVSHYVKEGTAIDETATNRGTSVYLVDRVVPMLPKILSNGICSLNPNVDRLAMSLSIQLDHDGKVLEYQPYLSVIRSKKQCTYRNVNKIIAGETVEGYEEVHDAILLMQELSLKLRKNIINRGYIEFEDTEVKFILGDDNQIIDIEKRSQGAGEILIENFMVLANECIASFITNLDIPSVYRIHDYPSMEKIEEFLSFTSLLGYKIKGIHAKNNTYSSKDVQSIMNQIKDKPEHTVLSSLLLRSMKKAVYSPDNIGHFGLASKCYTHFTSPIRRFPDTTIHRILKRILHHEAIDKNVLKAYLDYMCEVASNKEQASIKCEREVDDMKMAEYMEQHIGDEYEAMIISVHSFGMFVQLPNMIEGLVSISTLEGFFYYDESKHLLGNSKNGITYRLGQMVKVRCTGASKFTRDIDFEVIVDKEQEK